MTGTPISEIGCSVCGDRKTKLYARSEKHDDCGCLIWRIECQYGHQIQLHEGAEVQLTGGLGVSP